MAAICTEESLAESDAESAFSAPLRFFLAAERPGLTPCRFVHAAHGKTQIQGSGTRKTLGNSNRLTSIPRKFNWNSAVEQNPLSFVPEFGTLRIIITITITILLLLLLLLLIIIIIHENSLQQLLIPDTLLKLAQIHRTILNPQYNIQQFFTNLKCRSPLEI